MTAILQVFMRYKISESYCVFDGQCHECIKNVQNYKKQQQKLNSVISIAYRKKALGVLKSLKLYIF